MSHQVSPKLVAFLRCAPPNEIWGSIERPGCDEWLIFLIAAPFVMGIQEKPNVDPDKVGGLWYFINKKFDEEHTGKPTEIHVAGRPLIIDSAAHGALKHMAQQRGDNLESFVTRAIQNARSR